MNETDDGTRAKEDPDGARRRALSPILTVDEFRPQSSTVRVTFGARSHRGKRAHNEDHYLVLRLGRQQETLATSLATGDLPGHFDEYAYAMLVADGLGGTGWGALASRVALSTLAHLAVHFGHWNVRVSDAGTAAAIMERAEWFYQRANEAVIQRARGHEEAAGMATALTATYSAGNELFTAHVGHSRAYLYRDGDLTALTKDQTVKQHMADGAGPSPVARATDDLKHILTETIGGSAGGPALDVGHVRLWDRDTVLLCTNGLTEPVNEERIADVLALRRTPEEQCQLLIDAALEGGGEDNITVLLMQYDIPDDKA